MRRPCRALLLVALAGAGCARRSTAADVAVEKGARTYARLCATCHGAAGYGYVADNAPSLRTATWLATASDAFISEGIARGRPGTAMPAYARALGGPLG